MDERRTFNTPIREPWNAPIHNILKAIDNHTRIFLKTGDVWHEQKANQEHSPTGVECVDRCV
jgi:hypothetical protein